MSIATSKEIILTQIAIVAGESRKRIDNFKDQRKTLKYKKEQRAGGDLLFRGLSQSTIGAEDFQGRVRDGIVCSFLAIPTSFLLLCEAV